jgi:hypothetical protein
MPHFGGFFSGHSPTAPYYAIASRLPMPGTDSGYSTEQNMYSYNGEKYAITILIDFRIFVEYPLEN